MKHHYLIDTHHGPLVVADCGDHWIVTSPTRPPEIYDGRVPADRLPAFDQQVGHQGRNPAAGAVLHYWLPEDLAAEAPLELVITDGNGETVRTFTRKPEQPDEEKKPAKGDDDRLLTTTRAVRKRLGGADGMNPPHEASEPESGFLLVEFRCVAASAQTMINIMETGRPDRSRAFQRRLHFQARRWSAAKVLGEIRRENNEEEGERLSRAFNRNTTLWRSIFDPDPAGWTGRNRKALKAIIRSANHLVQALNDRFTDPSGKRLVGDLQLCLHPARRTSPRGRAPP